MQITQELQITMSKFMIEKIPLAKARTPLKASRLLRNREEE